MAGIADFLVPGAGIVTAVGKLFADQATYKQNLNKYDAYRASLLKAMYNAKQKRQKLAQVGSTFNTGIMNELNDTSLGNAGFLNSNTARAVTTGKLLGQRAMAVNREADQIDRFNKNIQVNLAESELQKPTNNPVESLVEGGLSGLQLGMSIGDYLKSGSLAPASDASTAPSGWFSLGKKRSGIPTLK